MIALRSNLPLLQIAPHSRLIPWERKWIIQSVAAAASQAGYPRWWLSTHVVEAVAIYFQYEGREMTITESQLSTAVLSVLQGIGYGDIARCFRILPLPVNISLTELASRAGHGYELVFFDLLRSELRQVLHAGTYQIQFSDLQNCVKLLRSAKNWRQDCAWLKTEIVNFIRYEIEVFPAIINLQAELS